MHDFGLVCLVSWHLLVQVWINTAAFVLDAFTCARKKNLPTKKERSHETKQCGDALQSIKIPKRAIKGRRLG